MDDQGLLFIHCETQGYAMKALWTLNGKNEVI